MSLITFERLIELNQTFANTQMGNEPNNNLLQYGIVDNRQKNDLAKIELGQYVDLNWLYLPNAITAQGVSKIGIKTFPQVGACAFANLFYEDRSIVVAPVFPKYSAFKAPTFTLTDLGQNKIRVYITNPKDVTYDCFRVVFRKEYFAEEFVTYELSMTIPFLAQGDYEVSVWGYIDDNIASVEAYGTISITAPGMNPVEPDRGVIATSHTVSAASWSINTVSVPVTGVNQDSILIVAAAPDSLATWSSSEIVCVEQLQGYIVLKCKTVPLEDIVVQVVQL